MVRLGRSADRARSSEFITDNPQYLAPNNSMPYLSEDGGKTYNMCHCTYCSVIRARDFNVLILHRYAVWSNFEIANMEFWRGEAYSKYFEYLESKGGFYYEVRTSS